MNTSDLILANKYQQKLRDISENYTIYTWWSNIPVYDCKKSKHFLDFINFKNNNLNRFNWNIFDDMLYNYFFYVEEEGVLNEGFMSLDDSSHHSKYDRSSLNSSPLIQSQNPAAANLPRLPKISIYRKFDIYLYGYEN